MTATTHRAEIELGPVVADGIIRWLSASAITKGDPEQTGGCLRAWHFRYVEGLPDAGTSSQALGQAVHKTIEVYLEVGRWTPIESPLAAQALRIAMGATRYILPHVREPELRIEQPLLTLPQTRAIAGYQADLGHACEAPLLMAHGIPVAGHSDLMRRSPWYVNPMGARVNDLPGTIEIGDWKTTKALTFVKTGPALLETVQMPLYGEFGARLFPDTQHVRLSHTYLRTQGAADSVKSTTCVPREQIARRWEGIEAKVGNLVDVARVAKGRSNDVDGNRFACQAFNRVCPYAERCTINRDRSLTDLLGAAGAKSLLGETDDMTNLLDMIEGTPAAAPSGEIDFGAEIARLQAEETAAKAAAPAAPATPPPQVATPGVPAGFAEAVAFLDTVVSEWGFPPTGGACAQAIGAVKGYGVAPGAGLSGTAGKLAGLKPVQDPQQLIKLANEVRSRVATTGAPALLPPDAPASSPALAAKPVEPPQAPAAPAAAPEVAAEAPKRGRGRPKKDATTTTTVTERAGDVERTVTMTTAPKADAELDGFELYVDCYPLAGAFESLDAYVDELCGKLCTKYECVDVRCAPKGSPLEFGQWRGVVAALARAVPPAPGVYVVHTDTEVKAEIAASLIALARGGARGPRR